MLPGNTRKMDKSTILQKSIDYLHKHKGEASKILFCLFVCLDENLESGSSWPVPEPFFFFPFQKSLLSQSPLRSDQTGSLLFLVMKSSPSWCWRWELWTVLNYEQDCGCLCFKENIVFCQALDGFFLAIMTDGNIIYASESVTSLLEHLPVSMI